jgi:hypothetical protein
MNLKDFLINQGKRAGIAENQEFQLMVSASSLNDIEVPDDIANHFNTHLMDAEIAKVNPDLKKHFIGNYMMGYDQEVETMAKEYGLPLEAVQEIKATKNSGDKVKLAFKHLKALEEAAKKSTGKAQSEEYVAQIAAAQQKLDDAMAAAAAEKRSIENKYVSKLQNLWEQSQLLGVQWNESIPDAARIHTYNAVFNEKLNALGGKVVFDPESYSASIVNAADPTLPLVVNGKPLGYKELSALVLQENKLLRETGNGGSPSGSAQGTTNTYVPTTNGRSTSTPLPSYVTNALSDISLTAEKLGNS